ncbi:hypothetical protein WKT22_04163 [Candidatus Lokiarchaeum ossiferum]
MIIMLTSSYLTFQLNSTNFFIKSCNVTEILDKIIVSPTPSIISQCEGLCIFREQLIPIINFDKILFQTKTEPLDNQKKFSKIIIASFRDVIFGFKVDRISKLLENIPKFPISTDNLTFPNIQMGYIDSVINIQNKTIFSINFTKIFQCIFDFQ